MAAQDTKEGAVTMLFRTLVVLAALVPADAALAQAYDANAKDTAKDLAEIRGEFAIVIAPPGAEEVAPDADTVDALLRRALRHASVKDAVSDVAAATGRPRREIYQRALALSDDQESEDGA